MQCTYDDCEIARATAQEKPRLKIRFGGEENAEAAGRTRVDARIVKSTKGDVRTRIDRSKEWQSERAWIWLLGGLLAANSALRM